MSYKCCDLRVTGQSGPIRESDPAPELKRMSDVKSQNVSWITRTFYRSLFGGESRAPGRCVVGCPAESRGANGWQEHGHRQAELAGGTQFRPGTRVSPGICVIDRRDGGKLPCRSQDADSTPLHTRSIAGPGP